VGADPLLANALIRVRATQYLFSEGTAMTYALACASHTPMLLEEDYATPDICAQVRASFDRMAAFIEEFQPDRIVQFSPDHYHGFHYDNMPSFCIGTAATSYGDWGTKKGELRVDEDFALELLDAARAAQIDLSVSFDMTVDHGFVQIWETMWDGDFTRYPIVPIFVNAVAHPIPTYQRVRLLGEAIGRQAAASGKRVLFAASGGLSHDPVIPMIRGATPELRDRLIGRSHFGPEQQQRREAQVRAAAGEAMRGEGPARPLNPDWDRTFLDIIERKDWPVTDAFTAQGVDKLAGAGGNEVLCWVAAAAALGAIGEYDVVQKDYIKVPGWIAGMAHLTAIVR